MLFDPDVGFAVVVPVPPLPTVILYAVPVVKDVRVPVR
jgi:hypothetical protein